MRYYEYNRIDDLIKIFDQFWTPYEALELGVNEGGQIKGVLDLKANTIYLEQYDIGSGQYELHKFEKANIPKTWSLDTNGTNVVDISL